ncbi:MAG: family 20 glycosylhydrolase, partial [Chitinophagaceae bacterium]
AGEVSLIRDHLAASKRELWIWGDRLLDGTATGIGMWEASQNNTHAAIDMIPKDVVICDWHYERADKTAVYFAMKGFNVVTCPWRNPSLSVTQLQDMLSFRNESTTLMKHRFQGMVQTVWSGAPGFIRDFYANKKDPQRGENTPHNSFKVLFAEINKLK